ARAASRAPRDREARRRPGPSPGHAFLLVLFAGTLVGNAAVSASLAMTRSSRIEPEFAAACEWLRANTPPATPVATPWEKGYEVQSLASRPTLTDACLESDVVLARVREIAHDFFRRDPDSLAAWCRARGATHLLVPPSTELLPVALLANDPIVAKLRASQPL